MPAAARAAPPAAPTPDVPRHVADLSDIQRCADSKKDDVMDRTPVNTQSWIAFRFQFYMALITRCNAWSQLNTLAASQTRRPPSRARAEEPWPKATPVIGGEGAQDIVPTQGTVLSGQQHGGPVAEGARDVGRPAAGVSA